MQSPIQSSSTNLEGLFVNWPVAMQNQLVAWLPVHDQAIPLGWGAIIPYQYLLAAKLEECATGLQDMGNVVLARLYLLANNPTVGVPYMQAAIRDLNEHGELLTMHVFVQDFYDGWPNADLHTRQMICYELGQAVGYTPNTDRWEALLQEAYTLARQLGDSTRLVSAARDLGMCYIHRGDNERGNDYLQQALFHAQVAQDGFETATTLLSLATASWYQYDFDKSFQLNENAYQIFRRLGRLDRAFVTRINMGELLALTGRLAQSEQILLDAIAQYADVPNLAPYYHAHAWRYLTRTYILLHQWENARTAIEETERLMQAIDDFRGVLTIQSLAGLLALRMGNPAEAIARWDSATKPLVDIQRHHSVLMLYLHKPAAYIALGNRQGAVEALRYVCAFVDDEHYSRWRMQMALVGFGYLLLYDGDQEMLREVITCVEQRMDADAEVRDALYWLKQHANPATVHGKQQSLDLEYLFTALKSRFGLL